MLSTEPGPDGTVAVVLQQRGGEAVEVVVERERVDEAVQLTCHVPELSRPWRYRLVEVRARADRRSSSTSARRWCSRARSSSGV